MALIHNQSKECVKTELDLFTVPYTQTSIEKSTFVEIPPVLAITDTGPLEFYISASSEDYIDLNDTYLFTRVRITNLDGTNLANGVDVGLINYPGCTLFSQVDVMLGDRLISVVQHLPLSWDNRVFVQLWKRHSGHTIQHGAVL